MKQRLIRIGQAAFGAFAGSLVLENLTRVAVVQLLPRIYDVQFAALITIISTIGGIFGAVTAVSLLAAKARRSRFAGWLALIFGTLGTTFSLPPIVHPQPGYRGTPPLTEALAYFGFTLAWSAALVGWGVFLLFKKVRLRNNQALKEPTPCSRTISKV